MLAIRVIRYICKSSSYLLLKLSVAIKPNNRDRAWTWYRPYFRMAEAHGFSPRGSPETGQTKQPPSRALDTKGIGDTIVQLL